MSLKREEELPDVFYEQLKVACKHYHNPIRIGELAIASIALRAALYQNREHPTGLQGRVVALQNAIRASLSLMECDDLGSAEGQVYMCLYMHIYKRDPYIPESGNEITNVANYLKSVYPQKRKYPSSANYAILLKKGLKELSNSFSSYLAEKTTLLEPVPRYNNFVDRREELIYYKDYLLHHDVVVIQGIEGIGKTALAVQLVQTSAKPVCWLTIRPKLNDSAIAVLYTWAAFLAQQGYPHLWWFMRASSQEEHSFRFTKEMWTQVSNALCAGLAKIQPLLCLDNLEIIPETDDAFWELMKLVLDVPNAQFVFTTRERPTRLQLDDYRLLGGLAFQGVQELLDLYQVYLTQQQIEEIILYTGGNPRLLELWLSHVRLFSAESDPPSASLRRLAQESAAVSDYLTQEILNDLTAGAKQSMYLFALSRLPLDHSILQSPTVEKFLTDITLDTEDFKELFDLGLLSEGIGEFWALSPIISDYLSDKIPLEEARTLHQCLKQIYELQGNTIESVYHAIQSGQQENALIMIQRQQYQLVNQGLAPALLGVLDTYTSETMNTETRSKWHTLRGEMLRFLGYLNEAEIEAKAAAEDATTLSALVRAQQDIGAVKELQGNVREAIEHYRRALSFFTKEEIPTEIWLRRDLAWVRMEANDLDEAWKETERASIAVENVRGDIARRRGDYAQALDHLNRAITFAQEVGDRHFLSRVFNNLGRLYEAQGFYEQAINAYKEQITIAEDIKDPIGKVSSFLNISVCWYQLGQYESAIEYELESVRLSEEVGDLQIQLLAHSNLAEAYIALQQYEKAHEHSSTAIQIEFNKVPPVDYAEALRVHAEVLLAQGDYESAQQSANQALELLPQPVNNVFAEPDTTAYVYETLSRISQAQGNEEQATEYSTIAQHIREVLMAE